MIFVSTGGINNVSGYEAALLMEKHGINAIELSGGKYEEFDILKYKKLAEKSVLQIHNYFPPPKKPFVFNLATIDENIGERSIQFARNAINLACELERPVYSFHAGFLVDPKVNELGKKIKSTKLNDRHEGMSLFLKRVECLANYASRLGVELLIENNVLSKENLMFFGQDPLLMTTPEEAEFIMENTPSNVNMLLDVAHLKVSAQSLDFKPEGMFLKCDKWIKGYHLSDNDGTCDSNEVVTEESWFWSYMRKNGEFYTLEIYNIDNAEMIQQLDLVKKKLS